MLPSASMMKPLPAPRRVGSRSPRPNPSGLVEQIRRIRSERAAAPAPGVGHPRRGVDVHDRRVDALDDVGEVDERSAQAHGRPRAAALLAASVAARDHRRSRDPAGDDGTDQKGDHGGQDQR